MAGLAAAAPAGAAEWTLTDPAYPAWTAPNSSDWNDVQLDASGRTLVLSGSDGALRLTRFRADGAVDTGFGTGGTFTVGRAEDRQQRGALATDGNAVYLLSTVNVNGGSYAVADLYRLTASGALDLSFNQVGFVRLSTNVNGGNVTLAPHLAVLPDGTALVTTNSGIGTAASRVYTVTRAGSDSSHLDSAATQISTPVVLPDGTFVVSTLEAGVWSLRDYRPDFTVPATFGESGSLTLPRLVRPDHVSVQDGAIWLAGVAADDPAGQAAFVARATTDGKLDPTFGTAGQVRFPAGPCQQTGKDVAVGGGRVTVLTEAVVGATGIDGTTLPACEASQPTLVRRLTNTGAPDPSYADGGTATATALAGSTLWPGSHLVTGAGGTGGTVLATLATGTGQFTQPVNPQVTLTRLAGSPEVTVPGGFQPITPTRVLDTRYVLGARGPVDAGADVTLTLGSYVVPRDASAVVMNVTATDSTAACAITVYPAGQPLPTASNVNCRARSTTPNLVTVKLGQNGQVVLHNGSAGSVQLIADVSGFYRGGTVSAAGAFTPVAPARILDTRRNPGAPIGPNGVIDVQVTGTGGIPASGVGAAVLNLTAVSPTAAAAVTAFPTGTTLPTASNLNVAGGETRANLVTVKVGTDGRVRLRNGSTGTTHLVVDVAGYYRGGAATEPGTFVSLNPSRVLDTRSGTGAPKGPVPAGRTTVLTVGGRGGVPTSGVSGIVLNATVAAPTGAGFVTVYPHGSTPPRASSLNYVARQSVANLVVVGTGPQASVDLTTSGAGSAQLIGDVAGYFRD